MWTFIWFGDSFLLIKLCGVICVPSIVSDLRCLYWTPAVKYIMWKQNGVDFVVLVCFTAVWKISRGNCTEHPGLGGVDYFLLLKNIHSWSNCCSMKVDTIGKNFCVCMCFLRNIPLCIADFYFSASQKWVCWWKWKNSPIHHHRHSRCFLRWLVLD